VNPKLIKSISTVLSEDRSNFLQPTIKNKIPLIMGSKFNPRLKRIKGKLFVTKVRSCSLQYLIFQRLLDLNYSPLSALNEANLTSATQILNFNPTHER
jgi:hypothetical protein